MIYILNALSNTFCKCVFTRPSTLHYENYNIGVHRNPLLPSGYNHNTFYKINDIHNTAYIDLFFSFICSKLTESNTLPSFPLYYGSVNGIKQYFKYDITEDYSHYKHKPWFTKYIGKLFTINFNIYTSDSDNESDNDLTMYLKYPWNHYKMKILVVIVKNQF